MTDPIRFYHRGAIREVRDAPLTRTVLQYLRDDARCTGTKEGCAEGDCGACTVVVGERDDALGVRFQAVNACIQFLPTLDGKALFSVEDLRGPDGALHPVQQALVDCHGSQCGFCTPGFVMSMWALYAKHGRGLAGAARPRTTPPRDEIANALTGNLCRCTGYRPILDAAERMFAADEPATPLDVPALARTLASLERRDGFRYAHDGRRYDAPRSVDALAALKAERPATRIVAGSTDVGLWVTKQMRELGDVVYVGGIDAMKRVATGDAWIEIGAALSLERAYEALVAHYPELAEMGLRFASLPIRNAGTLGGNVANGSPIGDSMPGLIALGARVVLRGGDAVREMPLEDLYLAYQKKDMAEHEFVLALKVPVRAPNLRFRSYKLSKRFDSDISAVCAAFAFVADGDAVRAPRVAFGGMAATPRRAPRTEAVLDGARWDAASVAAAMRALADDYAPLTDMRASRDYRLDAAQNLLHRFWLETRARDPLPKTALDVRAVQAESGAARTSGAGAPTAGRATP